MEKWKNGHEINLEKGGKKKIGGGSFSVSPFI
jgi:hypothetical protein